MAWNRFPDGRRPDFADFSLNWAGCPSLIVSSGEPDEAVDGEVDARQSNGDII